MRIPPETMHSALTTLRALLPHWETNQQIRETNDGTHAGGTPPHDLLPFGLDKTLDTDTHTATLEGAAIMLTNMRASWQQAVGLQPDPTYPVKPLGTLDEDMGKLLVLLPLAFEKLGEEQWDNYAAAVMRLVGDAEAHSGRAPYVTEYPCLNCYTALEQPFTAEGKLDIYLCPRCGAWWTPNNYVATARAYAAYTDIDCLTTLGQAAQLLHVPLATLQMRVKRSNVKPTRGKGRGAVYSLRALKSA